MKEEDKEEVVAEKVSKDQDLIEDEAIKLVEAEPHENISDKYKELKDE